MARTGVKVELESLHWLGMDYMCNWLEKIVMKYDKQRSEEVDHNEDSEEEEEEEEEDGSYASNDRTAHDDEFADECSDDEYGEGDFPHSMPVI